MDTPLIEGMADPFTDGRLLPTSMIPRDNSHRIRHYKAALRQGMNVCLTPKQREQFRLHYHHGITKSKIASLQQQSCSSTCKSMKAGAAALKEYIQLYMGIYDDVRAELLGQLE